MSKERL